MNLSYLNQCNNWFATDLRIRVPSRPRSLNPLERSEILALVDEKASKEMSLMVKLGCLSGLRVSEAASFTDELVFPPHETGRVEVEIGPHVGVKTKKGKTRTIEMPARLMVELYHYSRCERRQDRLAGAAGLRSSTHIPLFINQRRKEYTAKSIMKLWADIRARIRESTRLPFKHDFHDLRASYGTYRLQSLIDSGVKPSSALVLLMGWMGHDNEKDTWRYLTYLKTHEVHKHAMTMLDELMDEVVATDGE